MKIFRMKEISKILNKDFDNLVSEMYAIDKKCAIEISEDLFKMTGIKITPRSIQIKLKKMGIIRNKNEAFQLAIKKGRKSYDHLRKQTKSRELRKGINLKLRYQIFKRDNFKCVICGNSAQESLLMVDHIIPVVKGGDNKESNLRTLCRDCNLGKMIAEHEK